MFYSRYVEFTFFIICPLSVSKYEICHRYLNPRQEQKLPSIWRNVRSNVNLLNLDKTLTDPNWIKIGLFAWAGIIVFMMGMIWSYKQEVKRAPLSSTKKKPKPKPSGGKACCWHFSTQNHKLIKTFDYYMAGIMDLYRKRNFPSETTGSSEPSDSYQNKV